MWLPGLSVAMSWSRGPHLAHFPVATPSHPCLLAGLCSLGRWPPHPALKWKAVITAFPRTLPSAFLPTGHSGVVSGQPAHLGHPACCFPFCKQVLHDSCGAGGDRPQESGPLKGHFPFCLRSMPGQDPESSHPVPLLRPMWTVPFSRSGGSSGAEDASGLQKNGLSWKGQLGRERGEGRLKGRSAGVFTTHLP